MKDVESMKAQSPEDLFRWANLSPRTTGLSFVVWIGTQGDGTSDACVMMSVDARPSSAAEMTTVAVRPTTIEVINGQISADNLERLAGWVDLNRTVLLRYWEGKIEYTEDAIAALKPLCGTAK